MAGLLLLRTITCWLPGRGPRSLASRKIAKCGYLFVAPGWDFTNPINRTKTLTHVGAGTTKNCKETGPSISVDIRQEVKMGRMELVAIHQDAFTRQ
ncbi:unnamed protein product [Nezara viridula]|uniref:Uncharacterized protein n=1 Tax=Nezara viridula TaxID=85310 RepID=A0A9P0HKJ1_NEZVI|nr:unnamed protein product [Nezara viridula]